MSVCILGAVESIGAWREAVYYTLIWMMFSGCGMCTLSLSGCHCGTQLKSILSLWSGYSTHHIHKINLINKMNNISLLDCRMTHRIFLLPFLNCQGSMASGYSLTYWHGEQNSHPPFAGEALDSQRPECLGIYPSERRCGIRLTHIRVKYRLFHCQTAERQSRIVLPISDIYMHILMFSFPFLIIYNFVFVTYSTLKYFCFLAAILICVTALFNSKRVWAWTPPQVKWHYLFCQLEL